MRHSLGNKLKANGKAKPFRTSGDKSLYCKFRVARTKPYHGPNRCRYSIEVMNALTISALMKLPLNWFSFVSQKSSPL